MTAEVFHALMLGLQSLVDSNRRLMLVTLDTSHLSILPYVPTAPDWLTESSHQLVRASRIVSSRSGVVVAAVVVGAVCVPGAGLTSVRCCSERPPRTAAPSAAPAQSSAANATAATAPRASLDAGPAVQSKQPDQASR